MKVFEFTIGDYEYAYSGKIFDEIKQLVKEEMGDINFDEIKELPESCWDDKRIQVYEDNDYDKDPFYISIREAICGDEPQMIYSNILC